MRLSRLKIVVLPAPLGPMIVSTWPGSTEKLTPASALMPPKLMARSCTASKLTVLAGGLEMAPRPPPLGRAPAKPWRASRLTQDVSSQPLRAHVGLLAPERRALVEGKQREVDLDLLPPSLDPARRTKNPTHHHTAHHAP